LAAKTFTQNELDTAIQGRLSSERAKYDRLMTAQSREHQREIAALTIERDQLASQVAKHAEMAEAINRLRATLERRGIVNQIRKWFTGGNS
jgi:hypothetical protein